MKALGKGDAPATPAECASAVSKPAVTRCQRRPGPAVPTGAAGPRAERRDRRAAHRHVRTPWIHPDVSQNGRRRAPDGLASFR